LAASRVGGIKKFCANIFGFLSGHLGMSGQMLFQHLMGCLGAEIET